MKKHIPQSFWDLIIYFEIISVFLVVWFRKSSNITPWRQQAYCHGTEKIQRALGCIDELLLASLGKVCSHHHLRSRHYLKVAGKPSETVKERWNGFQHLFQVMEFYRKKRLESQRIWMKLLYKPWTCLKWTCNDNWLGNCSGLDTRNLRQKKTFPLKSWVRSVGIFWRKALPLKSLNSSTRLQKKTQCQSYCKNEILGVTTNDHHHLVAMKAGFVANYTYMTWNF